MGLHTHHVLYVWKIDALSWGSRKRFRNKRGRKRERERIVFNWNSRDWKFQTLRPLDTRGKGEANPRLPSNRILVLSSKKDLKDQFLLRHCRATPNLKIKWVMYIPTLLRHSRSNIVGHKHTPTQPLKLIFLTLILYYLLL